MELELLKEVNFKLVMNKNQLLWQLLKEKHSHRSKELIFK